jgi:hypothetical protein
MADSTGRKKSIPVLNPLPASQPVILNTEEGKYAPGWDKPNAAIERTKKNNEPHRIEIGRGTPGRS